MSYWNLFSICHHPQPEGEEPTLDVWTSPKGQWLGLTSTSECCESFELCDFLVSFSCPTHSYVTEMEALLRISVQGWEEEVRDQEHSSKHQAAGVPRHRPYTVVSSHMKDMLASVRTWTWTFRWGPMAPISHSLGSSLWDRKFRSRLCFYLRGLESMSGSSRLIVQS